MIVDGMKRCSKCEECKPIKEFSKRRASIDGLNPECKDCKIKRQRIYYSINSEEIINKNIKYRSEHKKDRNYRDRKYRVLHLEEMRLKERMRYATNPKKLEVKNKYKKTPNGKQISIRHAHNRRTKNIKLKNDLSLRGWNEILKIQNYKCCGDNCGKKFNNNLLPTQDHIIPLTNPFCPGLTKGNVQALCKSCNSKKGNKIYFMKWIYTLSPEI